MRENWNRHFDNSFFCGTASRQLLAVAQKVALQCSSLSFFSGLKFLGPPEGPHPLSLDPGRYTSSRYEQIKSQCYSRVNSPAAIPPGYITPFVIEATRRLGPAALLFLHSLCGTQTFTRSKFLSEINLICARTAGRTLKMTRDRFQGLPEGVLMAPMHV